METVHFRPTIYYIFPEVFTAVMLSYLKRMPYLKEEFARPFLIRETIRVTSKIVAITRKETGREVLRKLNSDEAIAMAVQFSVTFPTSRSFIRGFADAIVEKEILEKRSEFK